MMKNNPQYIDIEIDLLTNSIKNVITGDFTSKSQLIEHYQKTLGAINIGGNLIIINTLSALKLIDKYFKT